MQLIREERESRIMVFIDIPAEKVPALRSLQYKTNSTNYQS